MNTRFTVSCLFLFSVMISSFGQACSDDNIQNETATFSSDCSLTTLTIQGSSTLNVDAGVTVTVGTLNMAYGTYTINLGAGASIVVSGDVNETGGGTQNINGGTITITGDFLSSSGGTLNITNTVVSASDYSINSTLNVTNSVLTGGTFTNLSSNVVTFQSSSDLDISGLIYVDGPFNVDNSNVDSGNVEVVSGRLITMTTGADWFLDGTMDLQGSLTIDNSDMEITGDLDHDVGGAALVTVTNDGTLLVRGDYHMGTGSTGGFDLDISSGGAVRVMGDFNIGNNSNALAIDADSGLAINGSVTGDNVTGSITSGGGEDCEAGGGTCCGSASICSSLATVLPITLVSFNAENSSQGIRVQWVTSTEINNDFYTLERSNDGRNFESIAQIDGAGNSSDLLSYSYNDYPDFSGTMYYRLSQTDFDGTTEIFDMIMVLYLNAGQNDVSFFPNPMQAGSLINTPNQWGEVKSLKLKLISMAGKSILADYSLISNRVEILVPNGLRSGIYLIRGTINGQNVGGKIQVLN